MSKLYKVLEAGDIYGQYKQAGDTVELSDEQVKYLVLPYGNQLEALADRASEDAPRAVAKKRVADGE